MERADLDELNRILSKMTPENSTLFLCEREGRLTLSDGTLDLQGDLSSMAGRLLPGNLSHELLVKAVRIKGHSGELRVWDATAGLGEDALIMAAAGFSVELFEKDPVIGALLEDSLNEAAQIPEFGEAIGRMRLHRSDSIAAMQTVGENMPEVIFLDPMFPKRTKSGLIKKKFQLLQQIERPCDNEEELLAAALGAHPKKIVIKRPAKGPFLGGRKPDYSLSGKAIRYDCILCK